MALEFALISERVGDEDAIVHALQSGYEPFAVGPDEAGEDCVWFKRAAFVERDEKATDRVPLYPEEPLS